MPKFAEVIVPLPLGSTFTYIIPDNLTQSVSLWGRVVVPFGARKLYTAIVVNILDKFECEYVLKEIAWVPDSSPILRRPQLALWEWIADYYMCTIGEVYKAALPSGLKLESETIVTGNSDFLDEEKRPELSHEEEIVWESIMNSGATPVRKIEKTGGASTIKAIYSLVEKGAVTISEKIVERFRPRKERYIQLILPRGDSSVLKNVFKKLEKNERRQRLFMQLLSRSGFMNIEQPINELTFSELNELKEWDSAFIRYFAKQGWVKVETREISRFKWESSETGELPSLSEAQSVALKEIHHSFIEHPVTLLRGVTSSGKTEIYLHLMDFVVKQQKQVLMLVPEIALTTQLTRRVQRVFGSRVIIYHSRFSDSERVEIWNKLLHTNEPYIIIGARSSVFLPFGQLGLVIVDEEHEPSYKQFDPAPRYNARDVATVLASMHGAKTLLASATPSIETYAKAREGRYGLVELTERFGNVVLPQVIIRDLSLAAHKMELRGSLTKETVMDAKEALSRNEQVIFFHNRRGFAPIARCKSCEYIPKCKDCDVSLTYHRNINRLVCHYCGAEYPLPEICPVCKEPTIEIVGYGTERVEDDIDVFFPEARTLRMDLDTTRNKEDYATIIDKFSEHKADILVGTQMVTKGLDFGDVSMVAVLSADQTFNYPDFRSAERTFNMLEQVSGRAGRRNNQGKVIIQTRQPDHPVIQYLTSHDYEGFFTHELEERRQFAYPPFTRIIYIFVRHQNAEIARESAEKLGLELKQLLGNRIFGPHEPGVARIKNMYIQRIMVKIEPTVSVKQVKNILADSALRTRTIPEFKRVEIYFDVDPL